MGGLIVMGQPRSRILKMFLHLAAAIGSGDYETRMFRNSPGRGAPGCGWGTGASAWVVDGDADVTGGLTPWRVTGDEESLEMFATNSFVLAN